MAATMWSLDERMNRGGVVSQARESSDVLDQREVGVNTMKQWNGRTAVVGSFVSRVSRLEYPRFVETRWFAGCCPSKIQCIEAIDDCGVLFDGGAPPSWQSWQKEQG